MSRWHCTATDVVASTEGFDDALFIGLSIIAATHGLIPRCQIGQDDARRAASFLFQPFRNLAKHSIEYVMGKVYGFLDCGAGRDHAHINLFLPR